MPTKNKQTKTNKKNAEKSLSISFDYTDEEKKRRTKLTEEVDTLFLGMKILELKAKGYSKKMIAEYLSLDKAIKVKNKEMKDIEDERYKRAMDGF